MSPLRSALADYLQVRRSLGYKLRTEERYLDQFISRLERAGQTTVTVEAAVAWATMPDANPAWWSQRLTAIRGFASYLKTIDASTEVPPPLPGGSCRATPYLYSDSDIAALIRAVETLRSELAIATFQTLIGLLAVTGMRVGEAIAVDREDLDLAAGVLVVKYGKFGKSRALPLHASTIAALDEYLDRRDRLHPMASARSLFISTAGTRLIYQNVHVKFFRFVHLAGLRPRSATCRPRIHDLRHSFAVRTILDWYREGADVQARLPLLSTYMGHVNPSDTYWYLSAAPELLALAGERLERHLGDRP
jgi:integrase